MMYRDLCDDRRMRGKPVEERSSCQWHVRLTSAGLRQAIDKLLVERGGACWERGR